MNEVRLQGKLARDCNITDMKKKGGKMCFFTVKATREGGMDFLPVKAFDVPETVTAALVENADVYVLGRLQTGKYNKELKKQEYENSVVADEIRYGNGGSWTAAAFSVPTAPVAAPAPTVVSTAAGN